MNSRFILREPEKEDAKSIYSLIKNGGVLDLNSEYLYLLLATHFKESCCLIEYQSQIIGFVSAYYLPSSSKTLFIWQVAVKEEFRGKNLAFKMIENISKRKSTEFLTTTVSPSNIKSKRVFEKVAEHFKTDIKSNICFSKGDFINAHEEEIQFTIGPIEKLKDEK